MTPVLGPPFCAAQTRAPGSALIIVKGRGAAKIADQRPGGLKPSTANTEGAMILAVDGLKRGSARRYG